MCYEIRTEQNGYIYVTDGKRKEKKRHIYILDKKNKKGRDIYVTDGKRGYGQSKLAERKNEKVKSVSACNHCVECAPGDTCRLKQILNLTPVLTFLIPLCPRFFLFFSTLPLQKIDPIG